VELFQNQPVLKQLFVFTWITIPTPCITVIHNLSKASNVCLNQKLNFNLSAYRRLNLPLLWLSFIPSFLVDIYLLREIVITSFEDFPGDEPAYQMWLVGIVFLFICNQGVLKGIGIYYYFHIQNLRKRSYVLLKPDEVEFFKTEIVMTRSEMEGANEGLRLPKDAQNEFLMALVYHINRVKKIYRYANGAIEVQGDFQYEVFDEIMLGDSSTADNTQKTEHRCVIPGYFEEIETVYQKLQAMVE
jgi:hypothetical protein